MGCLWCFKINCLKIAVVDSSTFEVIQTFSLVQEALPSKPSCDIQWSNDSQRVLIGCGLAEYRVLDLKFPKEKFSTSHAFKGLLPVFSRDSQKVYYLDDRGSMVELDLLSNQTKKIVGIGNSTGSQLVSLGNSNIILAKTDSFDRGTAIFDQSKSVVQNFKTIPFLIATGYQSGKFYFMRSNTEVEIVELDEYKLIVKACEILRKTLFLSPNLDPEQKEICEPYSQ